MSSSSDDDILLINSDLRSSSPPAPPSPHCSGGSGPWKNDPCLSYLDLLSLTPRSKVGELVVPPANTRSQSTRYIEDVHAFLQQPDILTSELSCYPIFPAQFYDICDVLEDFELQGYPINCNPATLTLRLGKMSRGLHNIGMQYLDQWWLEMLRSGFIPSEDLAGNATGASDPTGLLQHAGNKSKAPFPLTSATDLSTVYTGFDEHSRWADMERTPDWSIYRRSDNNILLDKPLFVVEVGVSQALKSTKKSAEDRESLRDRAEAWLSGSKGITKAVLLINLGSLKPPMSKTETGMPGNPPQRIKITVELWRVDSGKPTIAEEHVFTVGEDESRWDKSDVPVDFPCSLALKRSDIYNDVESGAGDFELPLFWLRNEVVSAWSRHRANIALKEERKKRKGGDGGRRRVRQTA